VSHGFYLERERFHTKHILLIHTHSTPLSCATSIFLGRCFNNKTQNIRESYSEDHNLETRQLICSFSWRYKQKYLVKGSILWNITPCSPLEVSRCFGGTCRLHLQGLIISAACHPPSRWFLARLILLPWRWRRPVPPKRRLTFNGLQTLYLRA
jgi:hypothetical protein